MPECLAYADICQGGQKPWWKVLVVGPAPGRKVPRRIAGGEITPALERPFRHGFGPNHFRVQDKGATGDPIAPHRFIEAQDALTGKDQALEDPIERSAVHKFGLTPRPHSGDVLRQAVRTLGPRAGLPVQQVLDGFRANAQLQEIDVFIHRFAHNARLIW